MNFISSLKLAIKNIKSNKMLFLPYILSSTFMMSILYIMSSLISNDYIRKRHIQLQFIMGFGILLTFIFVVAFIIYINNFINKKRSREMSLYNILGLEKKHIIKLVFIEQLIVYLVIFILGILGGFVFGKISFMMLSKLVKDVDISVTNYYFSIESTIVVLFTMSFLFVINLLLCIKRISFSSAAELMTKSKKNESSLKFKKMYAALGIILLALGYFIAIKVSGFLSSLILFFVAVILVILGMYLFFVFSSTEILTMLRKNKSFYYKKKNFFWVSGMITRMKSNGVSMATITVLCTCIIVTLATTITINSSLSDLVEKSYPKDYVLTYYNQNLNNPNLEELTNSLNQVINNSKLKDVKVKDKNIGVKRSIIGKIENDDKIVVLNNINKSLYGKDKNIKSITLETLDTYNQNHNTKINLKKGEILVSNIDNKSFDNLKKLNLFGRDYDVVQHNIKDDSERVELMKGMTIVLSGPDSLIRVVKDLNKNEDKDLLIDVSMKWNVSGLNNEKKYEEIIKNNTKKYKITSGLVFSSKKEAQEQLYSLNGGFIFMGAIVSLVFLIGIVLVTYYKQVFEGYADRESIQIMKKVGLDAKMIKKNSYSQMLWFFFTPIIIAPINALIASKMLFTLLMLFGLNSYFTFFKIIFITFILVCIIYYVLYKLTSRVYYKIVN